MGWWTGLRNPPFSMTEKFLLKAPEADVCMSGSAQVKDNLLASVCIYKPFRAEILNVTPSSQIPSTSREERRCSALTVCKLRSDIQETPVNRRLKLPRQSIVVTQCFYCLWLTGVVYVEDSYTRCQTLDRLIKNAWSKGNPSRIAESLRMPLSTTYKIVQRLS